MYIAIAGNIGSGKTTLAKYLAKHYGWEAYYESLIKNPYIEDFYNDMNKWSFNLQVYFLINRFNYLLKIKEEHENIIQDRTVYEDLYVFATSLFKSGLLSETDFNTYKSLFIFMERFIEGPDIIIYLQSDVKNLIKQIHLRGRPYELNIKENYLEGLNKYYDKWINSYDSKKILKIDIAEYNFVDKEEDFQKIVTLLDKKIASLGK